MVEYTHAKIEDLEKIVDIYNQSIPGRLATADLEEISVESRVDWFKAHNPNTRPLWLIKDNEEVLGWISLSDFYGRPAYSKTAEVSIYLDNSAQGQGLGQKAIEFVESNLETLGVTTLLSFIFGHNKASLNLFKKNGFEEWGHLPQVALMDDVERDLDILGKKYED